jgi:hypothetical protein
VLGLKKPAHSKKNSFNNNNNKINWEQEHIYSRNILYIKYSLINRNFVLWTILIHKS